LKGSHGLVMQSKSGQLQCQLFGRDGSTVSTVSVPEFLRALDQLPAGTVVDFYDTCTVSLCQNSPSAQEVLRHCRDRGIAGATYIMCTDVGITRRAGPWPLPRTNSPPDLRTPPTPAPPVAR
jgi:hypothetical protein